MLELCRDAEEALKAAAVAEDAPIMQAYMKTAMPFYGVKKPARVLIERDLAKRYKPATAEEYASRVQALWTGTHREEKYLAIAVAQRWKAFIQPEQLELYLQMVVEGAWWDFVDDIAIRLIGAVWLNDRQRISPMADAWIDDEDMWVRRVALIGQIKHKAETDQERLFDYCRRRAHEKEFFIRKAIGWALRQHSYTAPDAVLRFVRDNEDELSGLSKREGLKALKRRGLAD